VDDHAAHKPIQSADRPHRNQQERQKAVEDYSTAGRSVSVRVRVRVSLPVDRIVLTIMITSTEVQTSKEVRCMIERNEPSEGQRDNSRERKNKRNLPVHDHQKS
jgi:hypothetical protein